MSEPRLYSTPQVAQHLGLTSAMVRRYQVAWENLFQQALPRDSSTRSRLIDDTQLELLSQAHLRIQQDPNLSVEDALAQSSGGEPMPAEQQDAYAQQLATLEQQLHEEVQQRQQLQTKLEQRGAEAEQKTREYHEHYQRLERELDDLRSKVGELFSHQQSLLRKQGDELSQIQNSLQALRSELLSGLAKQRQQASASSDLQAKYDSLQKRLQHAQSQQHDIETGMTARIEALEQLKQAEAAPEASPEVSLENNRAAPVSQADIEQFQQQLMRHEHDLGQMRQLLSHVLETLQKRSTAPGERRSSYYSQEKHHYGAQHVTVTTATIIEEFSNLALSAGEAQAAASAQSLQTLAKQSEKNVEMLARAYPLSPLGLFYWFWR